MIKLIKKFLIEDPFSNETRIIYIYEKNGRLYYIRVDNEFKIEEDEKYFRYELTQLSDIQIYASYFTDIELKEIGSLIRKFKINKILNS